MAGGIVKTIFVLHGPNLNLLGMREPEIYGRLTLAELDQKLIALGEQLKVNVVCRQSNHEGELIDWLHEAGSHAAGVIFNPAGYTHTSIALRDAIAAIAIPVIEVHLSNVQAREDFRSRSLIAPVCLGTIAGLGWRSYTLALQALADILLDGK